MSWQDGDLRRAAHSLGIQVAIDGPAGAGKSTVGAGLAALLGCPYLDTGLMYRAVTWRALSEYVDLDDGAAVARLAAETAFDLDAHDVGVLRVDGQPSGSMLRSAEVDSAVSLVSSYPEVRSLLVDRQRTLADAQCLVMVGRDIGTVVLPHAPVKLWVTASAEERGRRRLAEQRVGTQHLSDAQMAARISERDRLDASRAAGPLRRAPDAVDIETDRLTPDEALEQAANAVRAAVDRRLSPP